MKIRDFIIARQIPINKAKICIKTPTLYKEILFLEVLSDGSLVIDPTAYFTFGNWRFGHYEIPPGREGRVDVPIISSTKIEHSTLGPKMTYHRSGIINVGKAGRLNGPRLEATPLKEANGHFFTMMARDLNSFRNIKNSKGYQRISASTDTEICTFKLVGYLGPIDSFISDDRDLEIEELEKINTLVMEENGIKIPLSLFKINAQDDKGKFDIWLKIEYYLNFPYNEGQKDPSISFLSGWLQDKAQDPKSSFKCLGIIGGK